MRTSVPDVERAKCWQTLAHLEGRAKFSKYKLNNDVSKNDLKNDIYMKVNCYGFGRCLIMIVE